MFLIFMELVDLYSPSGNLSPYASHPVGLLVMVAALRGVSNDFSENHYH